MKTAGTGGRIAVALGPVVDLCLRQVRDERITVYNLFGQKR